MALTPFALRLLAPHLRGRVLAFGYPDLLMSPAQAGAILGVQLQRTSPHGAAHKFAGDLADTDEAFRAVGVDWICVDIVPSRGVELVADLNRPLDLKEQFDLVIDAGTIEHCANIGQALVNGANAVKPGGRIFHSPPLTMANHGFYAVSPTLLMGFYEQNGWEVEHLSGFSARPPFDPITVQRHARFAAPDGAALYFIARRVNADPLRWPMQQKYLEALA